MTGRREPHCKHSHHGLAQTTVSIVTALLLAACQFAALPQEPPPPTQTVLSGDTVSPTPPTEAETESTATVGLIQLMDPLDEPEYYCVDVPGFGRNLNLNGALTARTCKPRADDEMFLLDLPSPGQISMPAYSLCMEASDEAAGSSVHLADCSAEPLQQFQYTHNAQIRLLNGAADALCLAVASQAGEPTGGPSHLRRELTLESCELVEAARSRWTVGSATVVVSEPPAQE